MYIGLISRYGRIQHIGIALTPITSVAGAGCEGVHNLENLMPFSESLRKVSDCYVPAKNRTKIHEHRHENLRELSRAVTSTHE